MGIHWPTYTKETALFERTTLQPDARLLNALISKYQLPEHEVVSAIATIPSDIWTTSILSHNVARVDKSTAVPNFYGLEPDQVRASLHTVGASALESLATAGDGVYDSVMRFLRGEDLDPVAIIAGDNLASYIASQLQNMRGPEALKYREEHVQALRALSLSKMSSSDLFALLHQTVAELRGETLPDGTKIIERPDIPISVSFLEGGVQIEYDVPALPHAQEIARITPKDLRTDPKNPGIYRLDPENPLGIIERLPLIGDVTLRAVAKHIRKVAEGKNTTPDYLPSFSMTREEIARCNFDARARHHTSHNPSLPTTSSL